MEADDDEERRDDEEVGRPAIWLKDDDDSASDMKSSTDIRRWLFGYEDESDVVLMTDWK
jgi:hypothetical protein